MTYDDFCRCTLEEFTQICQAYNAQRESDYKDRWEMMRMLATLTIQPHLKDKIKPKDLIKFGWERQEHHEPEMTMEERRRRAQEALKKFG